METVAGLGHDIFVLPGENFECTIERFSVSNSKGYVHLWGREGAGQDVRQFPGQSGSQDLQTRGGTHLLRGPQGKR